MSSPAQRRRRTPKQREALRKVAAGEFYPAFVREDDGWYARWLGIGCDNGWIDEYVREAAITPTTEDAEDQKHETLHDAWITALRSRTGRVIWDEAACEAFAREIAEWNGGAREDVEARQAIVFAFDPSEAAFRVTCAVPRGRRGLRALGQAGFVFPPLRALRAEGGALAVNLSRAEAESLLSGGARELRAAGYSVTGVDIRAEVTAVAEEVEGKGGAAEVPRVRLVVKVAGEPVTAQEVRFLLDQGSTLVYFREHWIEVDRGILMMALRALERSSGKRLTLPQAIGFASGIGSIGAMEIEELRAHGWIRGLVNELRAAGRGETAEGAAAPVALGGGAVLRDYQVRGVRWLKWMTDHGFGALLADDMGLGKTIQVIAWLLSVRPRPTLVVAPLTLLANWGHELARFAPGLRVYVHQGETRHRGSGFRRAALDADVTVTSYPLLVKDYAEISSVRWQALVLDEAQTIKNPDTNAARAVRALTPPRRIALTGTPVENSVADVWSLEEFLNPGFLGDRKSFAERFVRPIALDERCAAGKRLRRALEPFVMRRLKGDPAIAAELGEKREINEYCRLSPAQRRDYETALESFRAGEHRHGEIFALITELKLICDGEGKLERLCELLEAVFEAGESALVFTQYAKVGEMLRTELQKRFGRRFPFLHGALSAAQREEEIRRFNRPGETAFILSLKAGGFGLNLVKATHVIHFDRWWNPAVENQATDRAHRIGQAKDVFVHRFVTAGTLEEHIEALLQAKSRVAGSVITENEWMEAAKLDE